MRPPLESKKRMGTGTASFIPFPISAVLVPSLPYTVSYIIYEVKKSTVPVPSAYISFRLQEYETQHFLTYASNSFNISVANPELSDQE